MGNKNTKSSKNKIQEINLDEIPPPPTPQLKLRVNVPIPKIENPFLFILKKPEEEKIKKIQELSNSKIGVLINYSLFIYSLNTFKQISSIKFKKEDLFSDYNYSYPFKDFKELKNSDLVLYTSKHLFFFKSSDKEYKLIQKIDEFKEEYWTPNYGINSVIQLINEEVVSCNKCGLKIYKKENNSYIQISRIRNFEIINLFEINENKYFIFKIDFKYMNKKKKYIHLCNLYPYDFINNKENIKKKVLIMELWDVNTYDLNYIVKDKYILFKYQFYTYIVNTDNMKLLNIKNDFFDKNHYYDFHKNMKFFYIFNYFDDFLFGLDAKLKILNIYIFKNERFKYYSSFPIENIKNEELKGLLKLKNNKYIIIYYSKVFYLIELFNNN